MTLNALEYVLSRASYALNSDAGQGGESVGESAVFFSELRSSLLQPVAMKLDLSQTL